MSFANEKAICSHPSHLKSKIARPIANTDHGIHGMWVGRMTSFFLKKWANPGLFFVYFRSFSNKHYKFLQQIFVKKYPSSIRCPDSNPRPLECESPSITTRPGLPPSFLLVTLVTFTSYQFKAHSDQVHLIYLRVIFITKNRL